MADGWGIVEGILKVASALVSALRRGDQETVDKVLSDDLKITLQRAIAEAEAAEKFGDTKPRDTDAV
jgi:hypothetical protein|tara:strand:- start:130 stop:330 length:201 start_codon:yes stop_codon:yes gene_type:complete